MNAFLTLTSRKSKKEESTAVSTFSRTGQQSKHYATKQTPAVQIPKAESALK